MEIYLIAMTALQPGLEQFLADRNLGWNRPDNASDPERLVEAAGRVCYMSFGNLQYRQSTQEYVRNLIVQEHESVLEHAQFTLLIDGVSRALTHQLIRHRAGFSYSQLSQQYHDESLAEFIAPPAINNSPELQAQWTELVERARAMYVAMLNKPRTDREPSNLSPKELQRSLRTAARMALLGATATTIVVSGNARAWRHVLRVRGHIAGDAEMRAYCVSVLKLLLKVAPFLFPDFSVEADEVGEYVKHDAL